MSRALYQTSLRFTSGAARFALRIKYNYKRRHVVLRWPPPEATPESATASSPVTNISDNGKDVKAQRSIRKYAAEKNSSEGRAPPEDGVKHSKEYSRKNVEWAVKNGIITKEERISFFHKIADIKKLGHKYRQAKNGDYIVDLGEKLLFTDADWYSPSLNMVVSFNDSFENSMLYAKEIVFNEAKTEADYNRARQIIEDIYWPGYVEFSYSHDYRANVRENTGRERESSQRNNGESVKFSMEAPVEQKENLIALHNLDETKLLKTLKLGGFPMPSIAITKSDK